MSVAKRVANPLKQHFLQKIAFSGPVTVSEYMKTCLYHPTMGFYSANPLGKHGHFITAPEVTSLFGEMLGIWAAKVWENLGGPVPFSYVELGPGRGLMCTDVLQTFFKVTDLKPNDIKLNFIENSEKLRKLQKNRVESVFKKDAANMKLEWHQNIMSCNVETPFVLLANEFFDAVPVHIYQKLTSKWIELLVDKDPGSKIDRLVFTKAPGATTSSNLIPDIFHRSKHIELSFESGVMLLHIAKMLSERQGSCLIVDYGHDDVTASSDTFRAFQSHKQVDPLEDPGLSDLTADVNFAYFKHLLSNDSDNEVDHFGLVDQGDFLLQMGIYERLKDAIKLCKSGENAKHLFSAFRTITSPEEMGSKFKMFAVQSKGLPKPPGFEMDDDSPD